MQDGVAVSRHQQKYPDPPAHLSAEARSFWQGLVEEFEFEAHSLRLLQLACEAWDRSRQARAVLDAEGLTYCDRWGMPRPRPEIAVERDSRISFVRIMRELSLDVAPPDSRPPARPGTQS